MIIVALMSDQLLFKSLVLDQLLFQVNTSTWIRLSRKCTMMTSSQTTHIITSEKYLKHNFGNLFSNAIIKVSQCKFEAAWRDRGRYIAVSAVIESPSAGTLVNFGELRGWEDRRRGETFWRVTHTIHLHNLLFAPSPNIQI